MLYRRKDSGTPNPTLSLILYLCSYRGSINFISDFNVNLINFALYFAAANHSIPQSPKRVKLYAVANQQQQNRVNEFFHFFLFISNSENKNLLLNKFGTEKITRFPSFTVT